MQAIRYSKWRLLRHAAVTGMLLLSCAYALASPPEEATGIMALFAGPIGRTLVLPTIILAGLYHLWRTVPLALSTADAISFGDDGMRIVTGGGTKLLPWNEFKSAKVRRVRAPWMLGFRHLILNRVQGRPIRLRLDLTDAHGANDALIFELIRLTQAAAFARGKPVGPSFHQWLDGEAITPPPTAEEGAFDADAALARYLARKKAGTIEAPPIAVPGGTRSAFGRKGL